MTSFQKVGAIAVAVAAVLGALAIIANAAGLQMPKPAWQHDIILVESKISNLDIRVTEDQLAIVQLAIYQNLREQGKYSTDSIVIPIWLLKEMTQLESRKQQLLRHRVSLE